MTRGKTAAGAAAGLAAVAAGAVGLFAAVGGCGADVCVGDSWQAKYQAAAPGTVLTVEAGTHQGQAFSRIAAKTGPPVVFKPAGGKVTVNGGISSGVSGGSVTSPTGAAHVELDDMWVTGEVALKWGSDDWTLRNVKAANLRLTSVSDIRVFGSDFGPYTNQVATINSAGGSAPGVFNILIDGSYFHDYTINDPAKHSECMQIWPGAASSNVTIRNTDFRNCTDFGVLVKAPRLTGMVFDNVTLDEPQTGSVATVQCNPNCGRSGSSIKFSSYAYPGARVLNSRMAGSLSIYSPESVAVSGTCTKCDPGPVTHGIGGGGTGTTPTTTTTPTDTTPTVTTPTDTTPTTTSPPACPGSSLPLRVVTQDASTITFGWTPPAGATGYRFSRSGYPKRPHTWDGSDDQARFAKGSACYRVEALGVIADGGAPG